MGRSFTTFSALVLACMGHAQTNMVQLGHYDYGAATGSTINSVWGWHDGQGHEYALVGVSGHGQDLENSGGLSIVDVTDPADPVEVFFLPGPVCTNYEAMTWGHYCYVTSSCAEMRIIDLSPLPASTELPVYTVQSGLSTKTHTCFIDENGRLYMNGMLGTLHMYDLATDPLQPSYIGEIGPNYAHDSYARGDTVYVSCIYEGMFAVYDVSDPSQPVLLGTQPTPALFTHNTWLDASGNYLFTTDETAGAYIGVFDISDLTDIQEVARFRSDSLATTVPHNTYWINGFLVTSYYTYGVVVHDVSRPNNPVEVGHYDTSPLTCCDFFGAWGAYPFLPSGHVLASDRQEGLFVLGVDYQRACWLEGVVRNAVTGLPIAQATVTVASTPLSYTTSFGGSYQTGYHVPGTYTVHVSAPTYESTSIPGVVLEQGQVVMLDVELSPLQTTVLSGTVRTTGSNAPIAGAKIVLQHADWRYDLLSDAAGDFVFPNALVGSYALSVAHWGHLPICGAPITIGASTSPLELHMEPGYYDDFDMDLGWVGTSLGDTGVWVRAIPVGTNHLGQAMNPEGDVPDDCGDHAFVTGNGGPLMDPLVDMVKRQRTWLMSPELDLTGMEDPHIRYRRWFADRLGGSFDDTLHVALVHGQDTVVLEQVRRTTPGHATWRSTLIRVLDHLQPTGPVRLLLHIADVGQQNLVEAGLDLFEVLPEAPVGIAGPGGDRTSWWIAPNPNTGQFHLHGLPDGEVRIDVYDQVGRRVHHRSGGMRELDLALPSGIYSVTIQTRDGWHDAKRMVVE